MLSCDSEKNCNISGFHNLSLDTIDCVLKLPKYKIIDSTLYDQQTILSYTIQSTDSSLNMNCFIKYYNNLPDIDAVKMFQKQEVEFNRDSIRLLVDKVDNIHSVKVGYLKYLIQTPADKFYEARIFFYKKEKLITIWLFEKYQNEMQNKSSLVDCIFNNIKMN